MIKLLNFLVKYRAFALEFYMNSKIDYSFVQLVNKGDADDIKDSSSVKALQSDCIILINYMLPSYCFADK